MSVLNISLTRRNVILHKNTYATCFRQRRKSDIVLFYFQTNFYLLKLKTIQWWDMSEILKVLVSKLVKTDSFQVIIRAKMVSNRVLEKQGSIRITRTASHITYLKSRIWKHDSSSGHRLIFTRFASTPSSVFKMTLREKNCWHLEMEIKLQTNCCHIKNEKPEKIFSWSVCDASQDVFADKPPQFDFFIIR